MNFSFTGFLSVEISLHELLFDGVLSWYFTVGHVEAEVGPLISGCHCRGAGAGPVGNGDGVPHTKVHSLHDALSLEFATAADRHGSSSCGHVAAWANELLAVIVVVMGGTTLFHFLQASPDGQTELLRDLQSTQVLWLAMIERKIMVKVKEKWGKESQVNYIRSISNMTLCTFWSYYLNGQSLKVVDTLEALGGEVINAILATQTG